MYGLHRGYDGDSIEISTNSTAFRLPISVDLLWVHCIFRNLLRMLGILLYHKYFSVADLRLKLNINISIIYFNLNYLQLLTLSSSIDFRCKDSSDSMVSMVYFSSLWYTPQNFILSVYLTVSMFVCPFVCLCVCPFVCLLVYMSVCRSDCLLRRKGHRN